MGAMTALTSSRGVCFSSRERERERERGRGRHTHTQAGCVLRGSGTQRCVAVCDAQRQRAAQRGRRGTKAKALESRTEKFLARLEREAEEELTEERRELEGKLEALQRDIDALYERTFSAKGFKRLARIESAEAFSKLGKTDPKVFAQVMEMLQESEAWKDLQEQSHAMKLKQMRMRERLRDLTEQEQQLKKEAEDEGEEEGRGGATNRGGLASLHSSELARPVNIVLVCGFESFNVSLYKQVAKNLKQASGGMIRVHVFSDRDIDNGSNQGKVVKALRDSCDVFFGSLLFDYDTVMWLKGQIEENRIPIRFVFESDLSLMSMTQVGTFTMQMKEDGKKAGPPPAVKKILSLFGSGREEDRMVGYLSMLKFGPKLLKYLPGQKVRHLRNWLNVYNYWNQAGVENVSSMFLLIISEYIQKMEQLEISEVTEMPNQGCIHPDTRETFQSPQQYLDWYSKSGPLKNDLQKAPKVAILLYRKHVLTKQQYIPQMIRYFEQDGIIPIPIFINGVEAHTVVRDLLTTKFQTDRQALKKGYAEVDAIVSTIGFPLVGGPAGSVEAGRQSDVSREILESKNVPYVVAAPLLIQDLESWDRNGMTGLQSIVMYALPELDGAIDTVAIGGLVADDIFLIPERVKRLTRRLHNWISLRNKPNKDSKVALLLYGFPPGVGATGTAALLNVPSSIVKLLKTLKDEGYDLGNINPEEMDGDDILRMIRSLDNPRAVSAGARAVNAIGEEEVKRLGGKVAASEISPNQLRDWLRFPREWGPTEWGPIPFLPEETTLTDRLESQWGELGNASHLSVTSEGNYLVSGLQFGNVWIGVQPLLGVEGDPMRLLFERDLTPHPQYAAFYTWLQKGFEADAVLHFGTHGTVEWLPGSPVGNTGLSWSDVLLGNLPNIYVYTANNPSESIIAKRRGYGTIVSHNVPPYGRSGLYKQLAILKDLLTDFREDPLSGKVLRETIVDTIAAAGLFKDCPFSEDKPKIAVSDLGEIQDADFVAFIERMYTYLQVVENRLFSEGLHVIGSTPDEEGMYKYLSAYFGDDRLPNEIVREVCQSSNFGMASEEILERWQQSTSSWSYKGEEASLLEEEIKTALDIRRLMLQNTEEIRSVVRALNGEYIPSVAGGDLLRDGPGVLPTGRNIHALDPYRMPSEAAFSRGSSAAKQIIAQHQDQNEGKFPETCAVALWGLDSIKTKGDAVAIVLHLVGARTERDSTGRIARFELVPLEELQRPRIDVIANMSGIFRDTFQNVVGLLDDLFDRAAEAEEEPLEMNFIRKHAEEMKAKGIDRASSRLFSNPTGDYGSMVNERVGSSNWEDGRELGDTWVSRNAFSYGKGGEKGNARPEVLESLLSTTDRVVQEIDSVEYGLTDIQEYYANTGALRKAAETAKASSGRAGKVGCSIVECFGEETTPKELEDVLRLEYRSKLLNPKWADAMIAQGSGGAYEVSVRFTSLLGWGATTDFKEDWVYDQAVETYVENEEVAEALRKANPQAFANILKRSIEAARRGIWQADEDQLKRLMDLYNEMDAKLEGVDMESK